MAFGLDFFHACDAKLPLGRLRRKNKINPPIRLAQLVEGSINQEVAVIENADVICNALHFSNLVRREENGHALGRLGNKHLQEMFDSYRIMQFRATSERQQ